MERTRANVLCRPLAATVIGLAKGEANPSPPGGSGKGHHSAKAETYRNAIEAMRGAGAHLLKTTK